MRKIAIASIVLGMFAALALASSPAQAQAFETWVSGTGSDTNNDCGNPATPCRNIYTALGNTLSGGTIHVLPGSYSAVSIDRAIEIIADQGPAIIIPSGYVAPDGNLWGIYVHAGAGDTVRIRGLTIDQDNLSG